VTTQLQFIIIIIAVIIIIIIIIIIRGWVDPGRMELSDSTENIPSDTTGNRSPDLPTSKRSALTTTPP
jgi:FtsZ-interacting cell division protein ZipA